MRIFSLFLPSAIAAFVLASGFPLVSVATAADNAEMLIRKGVELRRKGRDKDAADLFRQAYDLSHTPRAAAQLGLCEQALGQLLESEQHLSEALVAESDPWISGKRGTLEDSREAVRKRLGSLHIEGQPTGALVTLNDRVLGRLPLSDDAFALPGPSVLTVRKDGYESKSVEVRVEAGQKQLLKVELATPSETTTAGTAKIADESLGTVEAKAADARPTSSPGAWRPYVMWGALGVGVASLTLGIVSHVQRESHLSTFNDKDGSCFNDGGAILGGPACESLHSKISGDTTRMFVGYIGAAVFTGIAGAMWLTKPPAIGNSVACAVSPSADAVGAIHYLASIECSGRF